MKGLRNVLAGVWLSLAGTAAASDFDTAVAAAAAAIADDVVSWRRNLHQHPELSNREFRTAEVVAAHLRGLGLEVVTGVAHTGVVGVLRGGRPGGVVALRADMDALPVTERTGLPFASTATAVYEGNQVGVMHACGHDAHMAILMGAAQVLAGLKAQIPGVVKFVFQPAEEGAPRGERGGASLMIDEGVLQAPAPTAIFGLHVGQHGAAGTASYREQGFLASAQRFDITVTGKPTHGARPWAGADPIVAAAQIVGSLQTIVARELDVTSAPAVVTVGAFKAGVRNNIVPETATLSGTIRTFDAVTREAVHRKLERIATNVGEAHGVAVAVVIEPGVPVTFNDPALVRRVLPTLQRVYGADRVVRAGRVTGAEDFAFYQREIPGFFFFIGGRPVHVTPDRAVPNHSPYFTIDEAALLPGVEVMSLLALDYLSAWESPDPEAVR